MDIQSPGTEQSATDESGQLLSAICIIDGAYRAVLSPR